MDASASFAAWISALMHPRERAWLTAAVADRVRIERHGPIAREAEALPPPVEVFDGVDAAEEWMHRSPRGVTFTLAGAPVADGDGWRVEYALEVDSFVNGGVWVARLDEDGRIARLSHRPFPVPDQYLGLDAAEAATDHDHDHDHGEPRP